MEAKELLNLELKSYVISYLKYIDDVEPKKLARVFEDLSTEIRIGSIVSSKELYSEWSKRMKKDV